FFFFFFFFLRLTLPEVFFKATILFLSGQSRGLGTLPFGLRRLCSPVVKTRHHTSACSLSEACHAFPSPSAMSGSSDP
ncbi:hypothetical protein IWZ03DRAFT_367786, partial [Phyllosticta citriasiana]